MKKLSLCLIIFLLLTLTLSHAATTLNAAGNNVRASFLKDCDKGTVNVERNTLLSFPTDVTVEGRNCAGPDSGYQGYRAEVWDHFFWFL